MEGLDQVIALVRPPAAPTGAPVDWAAAESALGTALPTDYKAFCDRYGHGEFFNGWGWFPLTPFAHHCHEDLVSTFWRDILADDDWGRRPFPEPGGVLPFATSELKYRFWWLAEGPPDDWPVLVEDDGGTWHQFALTATELLAVALRDELFGPPEADLDPVKFFSRPTPRERNLHQPFVINVYGTNPQGHHIDLDLAGALGGTRQARLDALLDELNPELRASIVRAEAKRSREELWVISRDDIDPLRTAIQAWADRVSGWSGQ
ncbi:SMI1/KNR4 family protein [Solirubrobacter ginsenosidimutans]|uniref:SMI1/KNR4 family protein n=1 Tax=Solirubrobacter ginsenosidimutans TaxID=490573 RepID=A0A9X3RZP7_9ACTN|nr:SMI1/KNR4 family protein [Solirubrobacter ginsenosidimutans]MDA0160469.1 SMI1/KNR4 family protein [Solirubrobacter ginsenosidimutans]